MAFHATTFISGQPHRLEASVYQSRSGGFNVSLHESSQLVKEKILSIIRLMNESRVSYERTLSETLNDRSAHVEKSQSVVYAIYLRYLELSRSMASQEQLMRINGTLKSPSRLVGAINRNSLITGASQKQLVILPEHFSRRDFQQKISSCRKCSTSSPQTNVIHVQRNRDRSCRCQFNQGGQNKIFTMATSLWDGSQYKLTLVISLREKVLLKVIFSAFVHNMSVAKFCRRAVALCCQSKLRRLMKRCFQSIQFEGLSTRYITICSDRSADSLICKKYMKPALDKLRFNVVTRICYFARLDAATRHRLKGQMTTGFEALFLNKSGRRSLCKKKRWASLYSMNKIISRAFMAWCATSALMDHDREMLLTSELSEKVSDQSSPAVDVSFDGDSLSSSDSPFSIHRLKDCRSDRTENLLDSDNDKKEPCAVWNVEVQGPLFTDSEAPSWQTAAAPNVLDNSQNDDVIQQCIDGQPSSSRPITISLVYPRNGKEGNTENDREGGKKQEEGEGEAVDSDRQHDQQGETQEDEDADEGRGRASSVSSSSTRSQLRSKQYRSGNVSELRSNAISSLSERPKSGRLDVSKGKSDSARRGCTVGNPLMRHCIIEEMSYLNSSESGADTADDNVAELIPKSLQSPEDPVMRVGPTQTCKISPSCLVSEGVGVEFEGADVCRTKRSAKLHRGVGAHRRHTLVYSENEGEKGEEGEEEEEQEQEEGEGEGEEGEAVDSDRQYDQQDDTQEDDNEDGGRGRASSMSSSSTGSESDWSGAFTDEARNKNNLNVNKSRRILSSSVPCDIICNQSLPPPASIWDSTQHKDSSHMKNVTIDEMQRQLQIQNRIDEERRLSIQQLLNQQSKQRLKLPQSQPPVCGTNINSSLQDDRSLLKREHGRKQKNKRDESSFSPSATAPATTTAASAVTPQADWGHLPVSSVGKSLLDDSDLESFASLKGSSLTYVPLVLTVFSSSDESNVYLQGTTLNNDTLNNDTMQAYGEHVHKDITGVRTPGSLTQSSCDGSVCTPDSFIGYTAATLQGAVTPTPAEPGTGTGSGNGTGTGIGCVLQRDQAFDIPVPTPLKVSRMLPVRSLRCVLLLSTGVSLREIEALEHLEAKNPTKKCSPSSVMTSPEVSNDVLEALVLIRRCRRYFQKLRSTVRISRAYRTVRRIHRVCEARRCLTLWHGRALERRAKEDTMERLGAVRACRRVLKAWVSCSLVQPTVLTKAVIKMQEVHRMRVALLCWSIAMDKRKKENDRDDVLEQFAVSVHLNHTKRTKQHSWNAWLKSRNILEKEIKVQKLTKIASMKVMFHCWMQSIEVLKRRDRVKDKHRLRSCKDVLITWKRKMANRSLLGRTFCQHAKIQNNRLQKTSTPFRLLSSIVSAWREITVEILAVKWEIAALKSEKKRMLLMKEEEERNEIRRRKDERWERVNEQVQMEVARTYRDATLKALVFCTWSERVSHKKKQCEILQSYKSQREVNILLCIFKEWLSLCLIGKYRREEIAIEIQKRGEKNTTSKLFSLFQSVAETEILKAGTYYRMKTLQMHWHIWREKRTIKILEKGLGSLFGARKIYLKRSFECWIEVFRMKKKMTYAVQLLQVTVDRAKARRALGAWPGWKEYRRSEVMRKQIMLKRGIGEEYGEGDDEGEGEGEGMEERKGEEADSMQCQLTMQNKSQKQIKNKQRLAKNVHDIQTDGTHTSSWTKEHSPPLPPLFLPLSLPLSLAERLAVVVKDTIRDSSQASYSSALSSARNLLRTRTSILSSRSFSSMKLYGNIPSHSESYGYSANPYRDDSDNTSCSYGHSSNSNGSNSDGNSSSRNSSTDSDGEGRRGSSGMNATDHLGFFIGSLRGTTSFSAEDRAVKELLLLMQIVLLAWSKATKSSSSMRAKIRRIKHMVNKRTVARILRLWISRTSTVCYREVCWIKPASKS